MLQFSRFKLREQGFSMIELIIVVAIIGVLIGAVMFTINIPNQRGDSRNNQRRADINVILNAVYEYYFDNSGSFPVTITTTPTEICRTGGDCAGLIDLSVLTNSQKYLNILPFDPTVTNSNTSGYKISKDTFNKLTVSAPNAELGITINVTR
jgi:prepilin-type N-terminal cleavage/methylation domain-containing protein